jgi:hypothetical protein
MLRFERIFWIALCLILLFLLFQKSTINHRSSIQSISTSQQRSEDTQHESMQQCPPIQPTIQQCPPIQPHVQQCPPIQQCPPCGQEAVAKVASGPIKPKPKESPKAKLPDPPKLTPIDRQQLLAWVKKNMYTLSSCRDAGQPVYRMTVSLNLNQKGDAIKSCVIGGEKVSGSAMACIREQILKWKLPKTFGENPPQLVFGLQLD